MLHERQISRHRLLFHHSGAWDNPAIMPACLKPPVRLLSLCLLLMLAACGTLPKSALQKGELPAPLAASLTQAGIPASSLALEVRSVEGGSLVSHNAQQAFNPASVMKLLTTAAALDLLGPSHRWITRVHANGALNGDVLQGDLFIEGGGDPRFAHEDLSRLLRRLRAMGVREIRGDLVLDRSLFEVPAIDPAAFDGAPARAYNALPDALLLDARALNVRLVPDLLTRQVRISAEPPMQGFSMTPPVLTDEACNHLREQLRPVLQGHALRFEGSFPAACGERLLALHAYTLDASQYFNAVFRQLWSELGGHLTGQVRDGRVEAGAQEWLRWESLTLAEIIRDINKHSNNVMARQLLISLASQRGGQPATAAAGSERVLGWLAASHIDTASIVIENGSGLSRTERISADALAQLLIREWKSPLMPEFIASLPLAGVDGTMSRRTAPAGVQGNAHIKTGSLADVASMAGYLTAKSGRRMIVVCMINHPQAAAARAGFDQLLQWIYETY